MRTTTMVRHKLAYTYKDFDVATIEAAVVAQKTKIQSILEAFATTHGLTSDNLVSETEGFEITSVRSWPDLATAQAWVDLVLSGALVQGLDIPGVIVSAQVDPA